MNVIKPMTNERILFMKNVENEVDNVIASLAMEGLICTEKERDIAIKLYNGDISIDEAFDCFDDC